MAVNSMNLLGAIDAAANSAEILSKIYPSKEEIFANFSAVLTALFYLVTVLIIDLSSKTKLEKFFLIFAFSGIYGGHWLMLNHPEIIRDLLTTISLIPAQ
jgi:hypothetical protein